MIVLPHLQLLRIHIFAEDELIMTPSRGQAIVINY